RNVDGPDLARPATRQFTSVETSSSAKFQHVKACNLAQLRLDYSGFPGSYPSPWKVRRARVIMRRSGREIFPHPKARPCSTKTPHCGRPILSASVAPATRGSWVPHRTHWKRPSSSWCRATLLDALDQLATSIPDYGWYIYAPAADPRALF